MTREIVRPSSEYYNLRIPREYIGKDIEVIVLPLFGLKNEIINDADKKLFDPMKFYGAASSGKDSIDEYLTKSKLEWE